MIDKAFGHEWNSKRRTHTLPKQQLATRQLWAEKQHDLRLRVSGVKGGCKRDGRSRCFRDPLVIVFFFFCCLFCFSFLLEDEGKCGIVSTAELLTSGSPHGSR